jgi:hypothetical protein
MAGKTRVLYVLCALIGTFGIASLAFWSLRTSEVGPDGKAGQTRGSPSALDEEGDTPTPSVLPGAVGQETDLEMGEGLKARWDKDHRALAFSFREEDVKYPPDLVEAKFPPAGAAPEFDFEKAWPTVTMIARWTASTEGWPPDHRAQALDLILMHATDAELYAHVFPEVIKAGIVTYPAEFLKEASDPLAFNLAESIRGKDVAVEVKARGGFGAADYEIRTRIRVGLSEDARTLFYFDSPDYISEHVKIRDYLFAAHDAGDRIHFEARLLCVCAPRRTFRGVAMSRIEADTRYLVDRMYEDLDNAPTKAEIEAYLATIKKGSRPLSALFRKSPGQQ